MRTNNKGSGSMENANGTKSAEPGNGDKDMTIKLQKPDIRELKPKITVIGVGGGGCNAVNNMITGGLLGCEFVVANTDSQALMMSKAERVIQLGIDVTQGLGAGSQPEIGRAAAEECLDEIADHLQGTHMAFVTAGMGGGTGTGAAPVVASVARELGILTVGVVTKPFHFEGGRRMKIAEAGIIELQKNVDTLIVIPNQNLFRIANDKTTFADAFGMADQVLYSGVACITDLMVKEGLINLDFADVRSVMREMGKAMMGTGEASGDGRATQAAEAAISNPLLDETSMRGAQGVLISITGGRDLTLFEVDEAATRIREEVDAEANIILGATFDEALEGVIRVSVVATGIEAAHQSDAVNQIERTSVMTPMRAQTPARTGNGDITPRTTAQNTPSRLAQPAATRSVQQPQQSVAAVAPQPANQKPAPRIERGGVAIEPYKPTANIANISEDDEFKAALEDELMPSSNRYIPPAAETPEPADNIVRMPDIQDFPPMVRAELDQRGSEQPAAADERGPMGLLKKLTHGFGVRDTEQNSAQTRRVVQPQQGNRNNGAAHMHGEAAQVNRPSLPESISHPANMQGGRVDDNPYAPRRTGLDSNGRITPADRPLNDDDQLDIPAFLRRQTS
jgi:cell division protein FtsZ